MKKSYFQPQVVMLEVTPATTLCVSIIDTPAPEGTHASAPRRAAAAGHGI